MLGGLAILAALVLTSVGYATKKVVLAIAGAFSWLLTGLWAYGNSTAIWDLSYGLFWFGIGMFLAITVDTIWLLAQQQHSEAKEERQMEAAEFAEEKKEIIRDKFADNDKLNKMDQLRAKHGMPPSQARANRLEKKKWGL